MVKPPFKIRMSTFEIPLPTPKIPPRFPPFFSGSDRRNPRHPFRSLPSVRVSLVVSGRWLNPPPRSVADNGRTNAGSLYLSCWTGKEALWLVGLVACGLWDWPRRPRGFGQYPMERARPFEHQKASPPLPNFVPAAPHRMVPPNSPPDGWIIRPPRL